MLGNVKQKNQDEYENRMLGISENFDHLEDDNSVVQAEKPNWLIQLEEIERKNNYLSLLNTSKK